VSDADGRPAAPGSGVNDQYRLAVGMQGHQHRADLIRYQGIAESNLTRSRFGAISGVRLRRDSDVASVNLAERNKMLRDKIQRGAPTSPHCPGIVPVTGRTESDIAIGATQTLNAPG
jgi:hypothetical protein